jgi:hypothetical protein
MANFKTHVSVAAALSGVLATGFLAAGVAAPKDVWLYFAMGTVGGILPDIDADHSIPGRMFFSFFALVVAFLTLFSRAGVYSIVELFLLWVVTYVVVRHVIFKRLPGSRCTEGVSFAPGGNLFGFLTTSLTYHLFRLSALGAWMSGLFVSVGYVIHLVLDEIYSVDLTGARVKRSFGTALKLISANVKATTCLVLATLVVFFTTPSAEKFVHTVLNFDTYKSIKGQLLPRAGWFRW